MLAGVDRLAGTSRRIVERNREDQRLPAAVAEPYLRLWGVVACGWQLLHAGDVAYARLKEGDDPFYRHKLMTARFYFSSEMPKVEYLARLIDESAGVVAESEPAMFAVA